MGGPKATARCCQVAYTASKDYDEKEEAHGVVNRIYLPDIAPAINASQGISETPMSYRHKHVYFPDYLGREPVEELGHEVADNDRGTGPEDTLCRLKGHGLEVKHTSLGGRVNHGKLAADLVSGNR